MKHITVKQLIKELQAIGGTIMTTTDERINAAERLNEIETEIADLLEEALGLVTESAPPETMERFESLYSVVYPYFVGPTSEVGAMMGEGSLRLSHIADAIEKNYSMHQEETS